MKTHLFWKPQRCFPNEEATLTRSQPWMRTSKLTNLSQVNFQSSYLITSGAMKKAPTVEAMLTRSTLRRNCQNMPNISQGTF